MTVHKEGRREKKQRENMIANRGRREGGREREGFGGERDRGEEGERKRETGDTHTHTHTKLRISCMDGKDRVLKTS